MEQEQFLNMVIELETDLTSHSLLDFCQEIERELGRKREIKWGPRTIDLDILLYNQESIENERLILPHPRIHERAFVLIPLTELNDHLYISYTNCTAAELLADIPVKDKEGVIIWKQANGVKESKPFES